MTDFVHSGDSAGFHVPPAYARCFRNLSAPPKSRSLLQKTPQGSPADAEAFGSRALVALCLLQDGADDIAADLIQRAVQAQQGTVRRLPPCALCSEAPRRKTPVYTVLW